MGSGPIDDPNYYVPLRVFFERIFEERAEALRVALRTLEFRLDGLNELRGEVVRDRSQFIHVGVYQEAQRALADRIGRLEQTTAERIMRIEQQQTRLLFIVIASIIGALAMRFLRV